MNTETTIAAPRESAPSARGVFHLRPSTPARNDGRTQGEAAALEVHAGAGATIPADASGGAIALEALVRNGRDVLLVLRGEHTELRVNGLVAPLLAVLRPGDELRIGARPPLGVDFLRASPFLLASAEHARALCQLCRSPIRADRRILRCLCGALLHADAESEIPAGGQSEVEEQEERLFCAYGTCTACRRPIVTEGGYVTGETHGFHP